MFKNYLKAAWRNIKKHKGFSFINAGGLALGMASAIILILYITYHWNYDKQFNDADNIYKVFTNQTGEGKVYTFSSTPSQMADGVKNNAPGVEHVARIVDYGASGAIAYRNNSFRKNGLFADPDFFNIFSFHFIKGKEAQALQPNTIIITASFAETLFGKEDPIGKIITRNNKTPLTVTGVVENLPKNSSFQNDYYLPWTLFEAENPRVKTYGWGSNFCSTYVMLKDQSFFNRADKVIRSLIKKDDPENTNVAMLYPLSKAHLYGKFEKAKAVGGLIDQLKLFAMLALCILLVACVNFMNLSTARSQERAREVGIRKAIGSTRGLLIWQFISESLILSFIAMLLAVALLVISIPLFNTALHINLLFPYREIWFWSGIIAMAVITGLLSGSYPAFYLSSFQPISVLKGVFKGGNGSLSLRKVLVVIQFAFAVVLIAATICIYRQIAFIKNRPIGYDKNNLVEIVAEGSLTQNTEVLFNDLKNTGAITHGTTLGQSITMSGSNTWGVSWPGKQPKEEVLIDVLPIGYDFTRTTGAKLVQGREFSEKFPADSAGKNVMINEAAAKIMKLKNPVGTKITWGDEPFTIVGVYNDFIWGQPYQKVAPMISGFNKGNTIAMRLNPDRNISSCIDIITKELKAINPAYPPAINFVDQDFESKYESEKRLGMLANIFGGLAIMISCLGLFGLAAYAAEQRTKEIGVRKVLGASVSNITALLSKEFLRLVTIAIFVAIPVSVWGLSKWLQNYEYKVALSWWMFVLAGAITLVIAVLTVSIQAIKAALANPVKSLRSE